MNDSQMVLTNAEAAEIFRNAGYEVDDGDVLPVMVSRMKVSFVRGRRNLTTELRLPCWQMKNIRKILLRADNGVLIPNPPYSACQKWKMYEGFCFNDGTFLNLEYFSLEEKQIKLGLGRNQRCIYRKLVEP